MRLSYVAHILAGSIGLIAGYVALFVAKGGARHRRSGIWFVYAMLLTGLFGAIIAVVRDIGQAINIPASFLLAYLVITALLTVRPRGASARWVDPVLMLVASAVGLASLTFGVEAIANGGRRNGMPAFPFFMFATVGLLGAVGDARMIRSGPPAGARRVARHLWRMCFALFLAALSFFIGQAKVIPEPLRIRGLLAMPVLLVLLVMGYWLWRVRMRQSLRGLVQRPASPGPSVSAPRHPAFRSHRRAPR